MAKKTKSAGKMKAGPKPKISAAAKPRSRGELYGVISEQTDLSRKQVVSVFDTLSKVIAADLGKNGRGVFAVPGLLKLKVVNKPAVPARKGINPFTKQEVMFKAKPARNVVKVRPLKSLKDMV